MSHPDIIRGTARRSPDRLCVVEGERRLTFAEVDERADQLADVLITNGHGAGGRVALLAGNELEYLEIIVACQRAQSTLVPMNTRFTTWELSSVLQEATPSLLIHGPGFDSHAKTLDVENVWYLGTEGFGRRYDEVLSLGRPIPRRIADPDALATLLYTSGTTGRSKGAMITNRAQLARSMSLALELQMTARSVFLQMLPMFHLAQQFTCAYAFMGGTNVLMRDFSPAHALAEIARHRVTDTLLVPTILKMLLDHLDYSSTDLSTLEQMLYGGSSISPELLCRALKALRCRFFQMYGMTETGPATLLRPESHDLNRPKMLRSAGSAIVTVEVGILDPRGELLAANEAGEIAVRGPTMSSGYWQQLTDESARTRRYGWFPTGDVGYLDERGMLFVTDRVKDMIVSGGENISPVEVEIALLSHPDVAECAVVAVPDDAYGERVHAVIVKASAGDLDYTDLSVHCRKTLAGYKVPRSWSILDELPRTATGKVRKDEVRYLATSATHITHTHQETVSTPTMERGQLKS